MSLRRTIPSSYGGGCQGRRNRRSSPSGSFPRSASSAISRPRARGAGHEDRARHAVIDGFGRPTWPASTPSATWQGRPCRAQGPARGGRLHRGDKGVKPHPLDNLKSPAALLQSADRVRSALRKKPRRKKAARFAPASSPFLGNARRSRSASRRAGQTSSTRKPASYSGGIWSARKSPNDQGFMTRMNYLETTRRN